MNKFYSTVLVAAAALFAPAVADAATPADVTITVGSTTGQWIRWDKPTGSTVATDIVKTTAGQSVYKWVSNQTDPQLTLQVFDYQTATTTKSNANNMVTVTGDGFIPYSGGTQFGCNFVFTVTPGYYISHISLDIQQTGNESATVSLGTASGTTSTTPLHLESDFTSDQIAFLRLVRVANNRPQAVTNCQVTITPLPVPVVYAWCDDANGHLTDPEVVMVTPGAEYNVQDIAQKEFPNYTFVSKSPLCGTTITPAVGSQTFIRATYHDERNAIRGVAKKAFAVSSLEDAKTYLIEDNQPIGSDNRRGFRYYNPQNGGIFADENEVNTTPYYAWTLMATENGYKVVNNGNGLKIAPLTSGNASNPTMNETGEPFQFTFDGNNWAIAGTSNNLKWNGNPGNKPLVGWSNPHPHRIYEYVIDPYFSVTVQHVRYDSRGNGLDENVVISSTKHLVKAGSDFTLPEIPATVSGEGYSDNEFKYSEGADDLTNIQGHKVVKHFYDIRTGVESISNDSKAAVIFDLMGRKLDNASKPGIYVINGKKVVIK